MVQAHRIKAIALVGCTAVGKSDTAVKLAKRFNGAVISADSMQIYRGFDIGTGKIKKSEQDGVYHAMIDIIDGDREFSVGEYVERATHEINKIARDGKLPIIVGGTGLYVNALFSGCNFGDAPKDKSIRTALKISSHLLGGKLLYKLLKNVDGVSAEKISGNDIKRVIRALEIFLISGSPKSSVVKSEHIYEDLSIVLTLPREVMYEKIDARVKKMFDDGLTEEVRSLMRYRDRQAFQALGYKQIAENPAMTRDELIELVSRKTRNYAKRQTTYFKNVPLNKVFIDARDYAAVEAAVARFIGDNNG